MKGLLILLLCFGSSVIMAQGVDSLRLMNDLQELSSDKYEGRKPGTYGGRLAQHFLVTRFKELGLKSYYQDYKQGIVVLGDKIDKAGPDSVYNEKRHRNIRSLRPQTSNPLPQTSVHRIFPWPGKKQSQKYSQIQ